MGSLNRLENDERITFYTQVRDIKTHGRFNKRTFANNLALLKVFSVPLNWNFHECFVLKLKYLSTTAWRGRVRLNSHSCADVKHESFQRPELLRSRVVQERKYIMAIFLVRLLSAINLNLFFSTYFSIFISQQGEMTETLMRTNVKTRPRDVCNQNIFPFATFCSGEDASTLDSCAGENGSGLICGGVLRGVVSKTCENVQGVTQYTDVSQIFNWIVLSHLDSTLKLIDNDLMKSVVLGALDLAAYYVNTPKIADDFEVIKFLF